MNTLINSVLQTDAISTTSRSYGDSRSKQKFLLEASRTRYGINPQAHAMSMYQALPDGERVFDAFCCEERIESGY